MDDKQFLEYLNSHQIEFEHITHPAVYTVEESDNVEIGFNGQGTKNLFLRNNKGTQYYLVVVCKEKRVDLKELGTRMGSGRLSFGSADKMEVMLGVTPGSVTIAAILNDNDEQVKLFVDTEVWRAEYISCHPMVNTATIQLHSDGLRKMMEKGNKTPSIIDIPVVP